MAEITLDKEGFDELKKAVARNPRVTIDAVGTFLQRATAAYKRTIFNNPWRIGSSGGGAPVSSGNLRQTHKTDMTPWMARIYPTAPYAAYVHGIEGYPRKRHYQLRPWMNYAMDANEQNVQELQSQMLDTITEDLSK